ncbi:nucleotidyltransferase family protein [Methanoplanus limicola]|uniref:DNA polymerase beta domain protein region n=1 Tax=Methanoplanus limicola DSM 2279 TaxID=937775 RepID=H1YYB0_9EURY|nr:nucleotidyltransferase [Methanoplanus limicola]EHQ34205.1 DNA polymerase beta domain protein region [Methanoplanus limicola DSM 2279]
MTKTDEPQALPDRDEIISILKKEMTYLKEEFKISEIGLFGSYVRGEEDNESDIDILVSFSETPGFIKFLRLEDNLSHCLYGIKVDLVVKNSLKPNIGEEVLSETIFA